MPAVRPLSSTILADSGPPRSTLLTRRRLIGAALCLAALLGLALDASRPPERQLLVRSAVIAIHVYQRTASPLFELAGYRCRFQPTCSHYGVLALEKFGFARGVTMTIARISRCRPGTPMGTVDLP